MTSLLLLKSMLFANAVKNGKKKKKLNIKRITPLKPINLSLCRVCNKEKGSIQIFNNFEYPDIPEEIHHFSGITLVESDSFPKTMCKSCLNLLNGCIMFRDMCQANNQITTEFSIKKENRIPEDSDDDMYDVPSPSFSEENSALWSCCNCTLEFYDMESYNRHLPQCESKMPKESKPPVKVTKKRFLCDICGKTCCSNANLIVHKGTHENVFPFKCDVCPYKGRTIDLLKVHKRSHLAEKPFKCSQCPKATTTSSNLAKHMRHVHSTVRPFKCTYCEKAFSSSHDMKRHVRDIHLRQSTVECDVCFKKFNTKKILQGHRWKIHKIKGERQGRIPSYLQCRGEGQAPSVNNTNDNKYSDSNY